MAIFLILFPPFWKCAPWCMRCPKKLRLNLDLYSEKETSEHEATSPKHICFPAAGWLHSFFDFCRRIKFKNRVRSRVFPGTVGVLWKIHSPATRRTLFRMPQRSVQTSGRRASAGLTRPDSERRWFRSLGRNPTNQTTASCCKPCVMNRSKCLRIRVWKKKQIDLLARWVEMGAPPGLRKTARRCRSHWNVWSGKTKGTNTGPGNQSKR